MFRGLIGPGRRAPGRIGPIRCGAAGRTRGYGSRPSAGWRRATHAAAQSSLCSLRGRIPNSRSALDPFSRLVADAGEGVSPSGGILEELPVTSRADRAPMQLARRLVQARSRGVPRLTLRRQCTEGCELAIRRRRLGSDLQDSLVCVRQRPPHRHQRRAHHRRRALHAGLAVDQHLTALTDVPRHRGSEITKLVQSRCAVVH
jgi:hypothetical protein